MGLIDCGTITKTKPSMMVLLLKIMFVAILMLFIVLNVEVSSSTFSPLEFGCFHIRNITLYCDDYFMDFSHLMDELEGQLGEECSTLHVFQRSIRKSIPAKTHNNMQERKRKRYDYNNPVLPSVSDLQTISDNVEIATGGINTIKQQILLFAFYINSRSKLGEEILNELKALQEQGWIIILFCGVASEQCPVETLWLPVNRIFGYPKSERSSRPSTIAIMNIVDVVKNPNYDRIDLARKMKLENFDKSCFSNHNGQVVIHLLLIDVIDIEPISLLRNAIISASQFPNEKVKFVFHFPDSFLVETDTRYLALILQRYGITSDVVSVNNNFLYYFPYHFDSLEYKVLFTKKRFDYTKKNFILVLLLHDHYNGKNDRNEFCSWARRDNEEIHFFSISIHRYPLLQCKGGNGTSPNYHRTIDLYNQQHFFNTINNIVCGKIHSEL